MAESDVYSVSYIQYFCQTLVITSPIVSSLMLVHKSDQTSAWAQLNVSSINYKDYGGQDPPLRHSGFKHSLWWQCSSNLHLLGPACQKKTLTICSSCHLYIFSFSQWVRHNYKYPLLRNHAREKSFDHSQNSDFENGIAQF